MRAGAACLIAGAGAVDVADVAAAGDADAGAVQAGAGAADDAILAAAGGATPAAVLAGASPEAVVGDDPAIESAFGPPPEGATKPAIGAKA